MNGRRCRVLFGLLLSALACLVPLRAHAEVQKQDIIVWGESLGPDSKGFEARLKAFEAEYPQYRVKVLSMGAGEMNPQKLMTAIVGKVPPDAIRQDRFTISDWASRNAFMPLDDFIARDAKIDPRTPTPDKYYPAPWNEATYEGKVYGIPTEADDRVLYYNKRVFAENADALRKAGLDPTRPPRTWSEVLAYGKVLTKFGPNGELERAGWVPNYGNTWLYLFSFQTNASWISPDGRTCTMNSPETREALQFMVDGYDQLGGYAEAQKFQSTLRGGPDDPFITGRIAMKVDGDWIISGLAKYGPDLDFATAPAPIPDDRYKGVGRYAGEKDKFITWVGGFSMAIPRGARNAEGAWQYIKFMSSLEAYRIDLRAQGDWERRRGRVWVPRIRARIEQNVANLTEFAPKGPNFLQAMRTHVEMMPYARIRPATPVGQTLWDEQVRAMEFAALKQRTPEEALEIAQSVVQRDLDEVYAKDNYPKVSMAIPAWIGVFGAVVGLAIFVARYKAQGYGPLARHESRWGFILIAPWLVGFLGLTLGPMLASLFFSFTQYNVLSDAHWVGLQNYQVMREDKQELLTKAFMNVIYLGGVGVPLGIITGLAIALLLNSAVRGMKYYRTLFYMPSIVPAVATVVLWIFILNADPKRGLIAGAWTNSITTWFGVAPPGFLSVAEWTKPSLILMGLWGAGGGMILWLAGLKGIPTTLYEAASIDGATPKQQFWNITIPQLSPLIFFNTVMGFIGALQQFDTAYIITGGTSAGPSDSLLTPVYLLFNSGFRAFKMGYASALAWAIFAIIMLITALQFWLSRRWVHYEGLK